MASLAQVMHNKVGPQFNKILPELEKLVGDSYDLILDSLTILRRLFKCNDDQLHFYQEHYNKIHNIITQCLSHEYSKVVSEALRVAGVFVSILRGGPSGDILPQFNSIVQPLYASIRTKL